MFGSKNRELTRKYVSNWFAATSFGLSSSSLRAYSTKPMQTNTAASAASTPRHCSASRCVQGTSRSRPKSSANGT